MGRITKRNENNNALKTLWTAVVAVFTVLLLLLTIGIVALRIGNTGGFLQRYRERRAAGMGNYCYTLTGEVEPEAVKDWLEREKAQFEIPAVNAGIGRIDGRFCYTEHRQGSSLLTAQTLLALSAGAEAVDEFVREGELRVRAVMQPELPEVTTEDAMRCDTLIGSYTTAYRVEAVDTVAAGDSFNDLAMIQASKAGFLFRAPDSIKADYPDIPACDTYDELLTLIKAAL